MHTETAEHDRVFTHLHEGISAVQWQLLRAIRNPLWRQTRLRPCSNALWDCLGLLLKHAFDTTTEGICISAYAQACKDFGLTISMKKTNVLRQDTEAPPVITIVDYELDAVCQFTYLGSTITDTISLAAEIDKRIGKAASILARLTARVLTSPKQSVKTKMAVYNTCVSSTLVYGSETWTTYAGHERKLNTFHPISIRRILGISWQDKVTNADVMSRASLPSMYTLLRQCRLRWLPHGKTLAWFMSYLQNRSQTITISGKQSRSQQLDCGVPQGSVLGPILFNVYTAALGLLLRQEKTNYSMYADDTDLYLIFKPSELTENVAEMERTAGLVRRWMASNELKMNDAKTEVMLITPRRMAMKIECPTMVIGEHVVAPSHFVRNLGVILDSLAGMERQINAVCKTSYMHLYNISKIRCYLDKHSLACIIHAFVTCRLDYGNALLCGYPESQIQKLQRVLDVAARLISGRRKYDHITPVLKELHWLPVVRRIQFKVVTTVFKAMHDTGPAYLQELIVPYAPSRGLRSREHNLLCVPFTRPTVAGSRAFSIAGPKLRNARPQYLRDISDISTFKKQLKTYLFLQHYGV